jgi:hypothetical protein
MKLSLAIRLAGGLGNQLFQYATGRSLCIKNNIPVLLFDTGNYEQESLGRKFTLGHLCVKGKAINSVHVKNLFRKNTKLNKIASSLFLAKQLEEQDFVLQDIDKRSGILTNLVGYWQSAHYFNDIRPQLLKELQPKQIPAYPAWLQQGITVAVHVRRTDYLQEKRYGFVGLSYYKTAMARMQELLSDPLFVFFSDDMKWCRENFAGSRYIFFEEANWSEDYLQLHLMSRCSHQVIANSSFSWWAAWLNEHPSKIVMRPAEPFLEKSLLYEAHYPAEWLAIENK